MGVLCVLALGLAADGCAEGSASPGAGVFFREHAAQARSATAAMRQFEAALVSLELRPTAAVAQEVALQARRAKRRVTPATEWQITESGEEENLSQAELEINEGAKGFLSVIDALRAARRAPGAHALAGYRAQIARAREQWNQGTRQLWYLAHGGSSPQV
jgi:hypothetical protein